MIDAWRTSLSKSIDTPQREFLVRLSQNICAVFLNPTIVNIGVHVGTSMYCLYAGCPTANLIGVDILEKFFIPSMREISSRLILGDSNVVHAEVEPPVHLLFIDGCHAYDAVKRDIEGWVPKILLKGIVAFHDLHMGQVFKAFNEWRESTEENWEEVESPPNPGFRAFRRMK